MWYYEVVFSAADNNADSEKLWKLLKFCGQKGIVENWRYWQFLPFKIIGIK